MNAKVLLAVFKRNFVSYFANPTGYVFICVFVLLSSIAAFLPNEFFNTNLANLDQLNYWFPFIMLVFIPAITMSIWADERRQGTDELLLTIPAADSDIVAGKYLAAMAIYSVSLLFSLVCNLFVLWSLGSPDKGLFLGTYVGYWLVGLAMLAVGMSASFLTSNLTIAYVMGALFNSPLVFLVWSDSLSTYEIGRALRQWSIGEQFRDFGRGIISLSGLLYFLAIAGIMLFLSIAFIGRRHWRGAGTAAGRYALYIVQALALAVIGLNLCMLASRADVRVDVTDEKLSSLSPATLQLLKDLKIQQPVQIDAFISPTVPERYVQTRLDLLSMLRELQASGGSKVSLRINPTEQFSEEAARAEQRYNITPRRVFSSTRGTVSEEQIFMGVAFTCGLEKVVLPFIDRGIPVEYELARSIATIAQQKRKRIGILDTDAQLYGQFNMQSMSAGQNWPIITELEKQYDVVRVDPSSPITERYDALLAVQPSSLGQQQMDTFLAAIRAGQPTAIFEDPLPVFANGVPATREPKRPPGGNPMMMMGGQQPPEPKGDIMPLWNLLGIDFSDGQIVWQDYNPFPVISQFPKEFVFVGEGEGGQPFNEAEPISSKLQQLLFPFPGSIANLNASRLEFTPLVRTGDKTGTVAYDDLMQMNPFGMPSGLNPRPRRIPQGTSYIMAAYIHGTIPASQPMADEQEASKPEAGNADPAAATPSDAAKPDATEAKPAEVAPSEPAAKAETGETTTETTTEAKAETTTEAKADAAQAPAAPKETEINVVLVADIDMLHETFFRLREQGDIPEAGVNFDFDNVSFVLNALDRLAGDDRFIEIRKHRPKHRTLQTIETLTEDARKKTAEQIEKANKDYDGAVKKLEDALRADIAKLQSQVEKENLPTFEVLNRVELVRQTRQNQLDAQKETSKQQRDRDITKIQTDLTRQIREVQDWYKFWAVLLPPIPPLAIALIVFFLRRAGEREGVARTRLR